MAINPCYEYCTEYWGGTVSGMFPQHELDRILSRYANQGWRLHSMVKTNVIILVFERAK